MLIAHIVFRFDYGGLENGVVNVINNLPAGEFQHAVVALTEATGFADRLNSEIAVHALGKNPGKDFAAYLRLFKLLRRMKPDVVHTRNIGTMDCALVAFLAGVPARIHGEHGWDVSDPDGTSRKFRYLRRFLHPFVHQVVTVSNDLRRWLINVVGIPETKVRQIYNGVDTEKFRPGPAADDRGENAVVVGSVTRFSEIKDPLNLVEAFIVLRQRQRQDRQCSSLKLVMIGDGRLRGASTELLQNAGLSEESWLPGSRDDVPQQLQTMDIFVLGSLREGISNTVLEAMACGLPVVATDTGGNGELVEDGVNGTLVPPGDRLALANAIAKYAGDKNRCQRHGQASRSRVVSSFSINAMVDNYRSLYEGLVGERGK